MTCRFPVRAVPFDYLFALTIMGIRMARLGLLLGPLVFLLWLFCVLDVITRRAEPRHLPRWAWLVLVLFFPLVGSLAWLLAGRPRPTGTPRAKRSRTRLERPAPQFPEYDRSGRAAAQDSAADEEFLRRCRERAEEQRRRYRAQQQPGVDGTRPDRTVGPDDPEDRDPGAAEATT
jgi:MFS family permease